MTEFRIEVVRIGAIEKHPNADLLSITHVYDYPTIIRTGDFHQGDLAVYVPVDAVVPVDDSRWEFLKGHRRVRAARIRGLFSMGLLTHADPSWTEGQDVCEALRITKYEPPEPMTTGGENEHDPGYMPVYTDIEGLRRWPDVLIPGEEVTISEKLHGANGRFVFRDGRLWCASHHNWKKPNPDSIWWKAAERYKLAEVLAECQDIGFYGEVYGQVQDLKYGAGRNDLFVALFDAMNIKTKRYLDYDEFTVRTGTLSLPAALPLVPVLYRGPWSPDLRSYAEGPSTVPGANNVREGMVVRPVKERWDDRIGRVVLKLHGEMYLTRKEK